MIIGAMSFRLSITWWVALDQSPPPLRQPMHMGAANAVGRGINLRRVASGALTHISVSGQPHFFAGGCENKPSETSMSESWKLRLSFARGFYGAGIGAVEEELTFASVASEGGGAFEFGAGLVETAEFAEQIAAHAWQEMIIFHRRLAGETVDDFERGGGALCH